MAASIFILLLNACAPSGEMLLCSIIPKMAPRTIAIIICPVNPERNDCFLVSVTSCIKLIFNY
ncbi:hypothetical protein D3C72_848370 [compost metagenome]